MRHAYYTKDISKHGGIVRKSWDFRYYFEIYGPRVTHAELFQFDIKCMLWLAKIKHTRGVE